jgi:hypothetical protein
MRYAVRKYAEGSARRQLYVGSQDLFFPEVNVVTSAVGARELTLCETCAGTERRLALSLARSFMRIWVDGDCSSVHAIVKAFRSGTSIIKSKKEISMCPVIGRPSRASK